MACKVDTSNYLDQEAKTRFESEAASLGHKISIDGVTMDDMSTCSCGWKGTPYWDGKDLAWTEWKKHVEHVSGDGQVVMAL
jgi:hypothetical protein